MRQGCERVVGKKEIEAGASFGAGSQPDQPIARLHESLNDGQAQSGAVAAWTFGVIGVEDAASPLDWNPGAIVRAGHTQQGFGVVESGPIDEDLAFLPVQRVKIERPPQDCCVRGHPTRRSGILERVDIEIKQDLY